MTVDADTGRDLADPHRWPRGEVGTLGGEQPAGADEESHRCASP